MKEVRNVLIGYELGAESSQISYYDRSAGEPVSVPTKVGTSLYEFPTAMTYVPARKEWHFGLEAAWFGQRDGNIALAGLYDLWCGRESVEVDGEMLKPSAILAVFLRESLRLLGLSDLSASVARITITARSLSPDLVANLREALTSLGLAAGQFSVIDYAESFFYYAWSQRQDVWRLGVGLFSFSEKEAVFSRLTASRNTRPALVSLKADEPVVLPEDAYAADTTLLTYADERVDEGVWSSVFLMGEAALTERFPRTVRFLARKCRHVYYGSNLYVKGACYASFAQKEKGGFKDYLFSGEHMVRANLGMELKVAGVNSYYPFFAAGDNWYDAAREADVILSDDRQLTFSMSSMDGTGKRTILLPLDNLPERPEGATRIRISVTCTSSTECRITAEDLGFGGFFPASHMKWTETVSLGGEE